jgi:hypothetical protein
LHLKGIDPLELPLNRGLVWADWEHEWQQPTLPPQPEIRRCGWFGGRWRDRTSDLLLVRETLCR